MVAALALVLSLAACGAAPAPTKAIGDPVRGKVLVGRQACGACHQIPHIPQADGMVGPPLAGVARRTIIAGYLPNTPDNMARWVQSPQSVAPGNAMPDMGLSDRDARDIAAYLATLR
jgi:cytochrome c2